MCELQKEKGRIIFVGVILLDQISKFLALKSGIGFINEGISFGLLFDCSMVALLAVFVACFFIFLWFLRVKNNFLLWLIFAGGTSNLLDRLRLGGIVDFISLPLIPVFNLADVAICFGIFFAVVDFVKLKKV